MIKILEENDQYLICIKEVGIDSEHEMVSLLKDQCHTNIFPIHRLDKIVGGIMIFAKKKEACALPFEKEYLAVIEGTLDEKEGILTDLLFHDKKSNKTFVVKRKRNGVKEASLSYQVLEEKDNKSLVKINLQTGRTHQIRIQFASRKHPLVGDGKYGSKDNKCSVALWSYQIKIGGTIYQENPPMIYPFNLFQE